jgi:hypothetical protein
MRGAVRAILLFAVAVFMAGEADSSEQRTMVWDTCKRFSDGSAELNKRDGWQRVAPDASAGYAFKGDAVIENDKLQLLLGAACGGPVVYSRSGVGKEPRRMSLIPLSAKREPCETITAIKIIKNTGEEVALEVSSRSAAGDSARTSFSLRPGRAFVEVKPVENAVALRVCARARFALMPDFFGDDMVFDPRKSAGGRLFVPAENCLLSFTGDGNTILMGVWPLGDQEVQAVVSGEKEDRFFEAVEISFDNKSLYLAVLDGPGLWHTMALEQASCFDKDIATGWKKPFDARWRGDFRLADRTDSWEFESQRKPDVQVHLFGQKVVWPFWFDDGKAMIRLAKKDYLGTALIYPLERGQNTPLTMFTPVDILRETLGTGPCEYILDREGVGTRNPGGKRRLVSTGVCNTTGRMQHFFELGLECKESKLIQDMAEDVLAFNITVRQRLEEYKAFARQLTQLCNEAKRTNPAVKPVADRVEQLEKRLEDLFKERLPKMKTPEQGVELIQKVKALTKEEDPENLAKYLSLGAELRGLAGTQDSLAAVFRCEVRRFRRELGVIATGDSAAAKFAEKLRELARNALRKKHYTEGT